MDKASNKFLVFCIYLVLALSTLGVYWQVRNHDFLNYDDDKYVTENQHVQAGLARSSIIWAFTSECGGNWHPLTMLSHMLDCQLFGTNPGRHHLINLLFHIANTLLLFAIFRQMTGGLWQSAFVAALFALHPLHVESVAWISERKDVLSTLFWFLTIFAYLRYVRRPAGAGRYLLTLLLFALGLMAKPMLVTLPFVLLLLDYWPLARFQLNRNIQWPVVLKLIWEKVPFFVLSAVSSIVTFLVQRSAGAVKQAGMFPLMTRIANAFVSYAEYIGKMIWPSRLAVYYPHPLNAIPLWQIIAAFLLLIGVSVWVIRLSSKHRYLSVGWFWYIGTLVPVIGLVQIGGQALADRYTYIPLIGLFVIIAWGLPDLLAKWKYRKAALGILLLAVLSALSVCTFFQLRHWRNGMTLFEHTLKVTKNNDVANYSLGQWLYNHGKVDRSIPYYSEALRIAPDYMLAYTGLGMALAQQGRLDEAIAQLTEALRIKPDYSLAHAGLGVALGRQGRFDEAITHLTEALRSNPDFVEARSDLGYALACQHKFDQAIVNFREALRLDPNHALSHYHLATILVEQGQVEEAIQHFRDALRLKHDWISPMRDLAWLLATHKEAKNRDPQEAIRLAQRACELTKYQQAGIMDTLAAAYAAAGEFSEAVVTAEKALKLAQSSQQKEVTEQIQNRLNLYKASQPYIEPPPK